VLRDVELYQSIQRADGAVITSEGFAAPALLVLAKRDPKLPDARLEAMSNPLRFTRDVDVEHDGPIAVAIARALRPAQRNALLAKLYRNTPSWVTSGKQLLEQVMVEAPADELTECLIQRVGELKAEYAYGRTYDSALFGKGYTPAKLEAMAPSTHPQTAPLLVHIRAYAAAARSKKLDQAIAKFLAM
jgi:hypothetical protein